MNENEAGDATMPGYPIELDLRGKPALVVGLGAVGRRKASGLLAAGARVLGVDPGQGGWDAPEGIEVRAEAYRAEHLHRVVLAWAAATEEVNRQVVADARRLGVWVGSASAPGDGDFTLPAVHRDGPLTLTVSTGGASPALAAALRDRAASSLGPAASGLAALLIELRPEVLARLPDPARRRRVLTDWADPRWLDLWQTEGADVVRRRLIEALDRMTSLPDGDPP